MAKKMSIKDLNKYLSSFKYGSIYGEFPYDYYSIEPALFEREKTGICWDFVAYEAWYFNKYFPKTDYRVYYIESDDGEFCHSFLVYKRIGMYHLFEACRAPKGIKQFNTIEELLNYQVEKLVPYDIDNNRMPYIIFEYTPPEEYDLAVDAYMKHIYHTGKKIRSYENYFGLISGV